MKKTIRKMVMIVEKAIIGTSSVFAQKSGNFKPSAVSISDNLEYNIDYKTEKQEIKLDDFHGQDFMITIQDSKPYNFKFSETWDFLLCDEKTVRFQDSEYYQSANRGALWIYTKQKVEAASHCQGGQTITTYFLAEKEMDMKVFLN